MNFFIDSIKLKSLIFNSCANENSSIKILIVYFGQSKDTKTNFCYIDLSSGKCEGNKFNSTYLSCCCTIGAAWGDETGKSCNACPAKYSGRKTNLVQTSIHFFDNLFF